MDKDTYIEYKKVAEGLIYKAEKRNPELAEYLKTHFVFDEKNHNMFYTGANTVLEDLMRGQSK